MKMTTLRIHNIVFLFYSLALKGPQSNCFSRGISSRGCQAEQGNGSKKQPSACFDEGGGPPDTAELLDSAESMGNSSSLWTLDEHEESKEDGEHDEGDVQDDHEQGI